MAGNGRTWVYALTALNVAFPILVGWLSPPRIPGYYAPLARILALAASFSTALLASRRLIASSSNTAVIAALASPGFSSPAEFIYAGALSAAVAYAAYTKGLSPLSARAEAGELASAARLLGELARDPGRALKNRYTPLLLSASALSLSLVAVLYYASSAPVSTILLLTPLWLSVAMGIASAGSGASAAGAVKAGLISGLSTLSLIPSLYTASSVDAARILTPSPAGSSGAIIKLGRALAVLEHGEPRGEYKGFPQHWVSRGRPCWYWRRAEGEVAVPVESMMNTHTVIAGASGAGKSTLARSLIKQFSAVKKSILVIDPHGEYSNLGSLLGDVRTVDASEIFLNPLDLSGLSPLDKAKEFSQTLALLFGLGPLQRIMLEELLVKTYESKGIIAGDPSTWTRPPPTPTDLEHACADSAGGGEEYARICPYVRVLARHFPREAPVSLPSLLEKPAVVSLNKLASDFSRTLLVETLLYSVLSAMYGGRLSDLLIVVDEVRAALPGGVGDRILSRLFSESRKFGITLIVVSQDAGSIPGVILNNAGLKIFFNTSEPESLEYAVKSVAGVSDSERALAVSTALRGLGAFEFLVDVAGLNKVFIAKNPYRSL
ncbi:MAG: ATP-binding protein [Thermosphaera sp.]